MLAAGAGVAGKKYYDNRNNKKSADLKEKE
jgi:hypothetical protein